MNKVTLIGRLAADPELRTTQSGLSVCSFRLAVPRRFKSQQGEKETDFFNIIAWRATADLCAQYLSKGKQCAVAGSLQTRSYDDRDGNKRHVTEIVADEVEFLTPRGEQGGADGNAPSQGDGFTEVDDDDLPF